MTAIQSQDDLAALFSRNLHLEQPAPQEPAQDVAVTQTTKPEEAITYSITQHYHHSAHIVPQQQPSRPASVPSVTDQQTTEIILARHGVDISTLFPSQVELFKTADSGQQMRLVELWRISPPSFGGHALTHDLGNWPQTSFQQEEALAKLRYERQMLDERAARRGAGEEDHISEDVMSDGEQRNPLVPLQGGDGRWSGSYKPGHNTEPEPYMMSGYEALAQRDYNIQARQVPKDSYSHFGTAVGGPTYKQATDPAYKSISGNSGLSANDETEWMKDVRQQQDMENAYGRLQEDYIYGTIGYARSHDEDEEML